MRRQLAVVLPMMLWLAGCAANEPPVAVAPAFIRERLVERMAIMSGPNGETQLYFRRDGLATATGKTAEFIRWRTDPERGLCLRWYGKPEICSPLIEVNNARYRWANRAINVLDVDPVHSRF